MSAEQLMEALHNILLAVNINFVRSVLLEHLVCSFTWRKHMAAAQSHPLYLIQNLSCFSKVEVK